MIDVVFMGRGVIAEHCFSKLLDHPDYRVVGVATNFSPYATWWRSCAIAQKAGRAGLPMIDSSTKPQEEHYLALLPKDRKILLLSVQYSWILSEAVLARAAGGGYNLHNAKLPEYGGHFTIAHEIANAEPRHYCTINQMVPKVDAGDIVVEDWIPINDRDTACSLFWRSVGLARSVFDQFLAGYAGNTLRPKSSTDGLRRFYRKSDFEDLHHRQDLDAFRKDRALYFPCAVPTPAFCNCKEEPCLEISQ